MDNTKTLETERLILRKFTVEDAERMFNSWATDSKTKFVYLNTNNINTLATTMPHNTAFFLLEDVYFSNVNVPKNVIAVLPISINEYQTLMLMQNM